MELIAEKQQNEQNVLESREPYFVNVNAETLIICGDDREISSSDNIDIACLHLFGGGLNIAFNRQIARTISGVLVPEDLGRALTEQIGEIEEKAHLHLGVHSDDSTEHGYKILGLSDADKIGCAYWQKRADISRAIVEHGEELTYKAKRLFPELYIDKQNTEDFTKKIIDAHASLVKTQITPGREIVTKAITKGATGVVLVGSHSAKTGIINIRKNSTFDTNKAVVENMPSYEHDLWVALEAYDRLLDVPCSKEEWALIEILDALATFKLLGVETVAVRR